MQATALVQHLCHKLWFFVSYDRVGATCSRRSSDERVTVHVVTQDVVAMLDIVVVGWWWRRLRGVVAGACGVLEFFEYSPPPADGVGFPWPFAGTDWICCSEWWTWKIVLAVMLAGWKI